MAKKKPSKGAQKPNTIPSRSRKPAVKAGTKPSRSSKSVALTGPSRRTIKRLFAVSGNKCAHPGCDSRLVDKESGSILGEICHIKGEKPGSARYDAVQLASERQAFENLILMCGSHHKVIDDDEKTYTVERLKDIKAKHELGQPSVGALTDRQADVFISNASKLINSPVSVIKTTNQSGGQTAQIINNITHAPPGQDLVEVEGKLSIGGSLDELQRIGSPGLVLTIVCRSTRPAKIRRALLCVEGRGFVDALQGGFAASFGYDPPEGLETETLCFELLPLSKPDSSEGFVLQRDDVKRFYLPIATPSLGLGLTAPKEKVSIRVEFFDGTERFLLSGDDVQSMLNGLVQAHGEDKHSLNVEMSMHVRVNSRTLPRGSQLVGAVNPKPVSFVDAALGQPYGTAQGQSVRCAIRVGHFAPTGENTVCVQVVHVGSEPIVELSAAFVASDSAPLKLVEGASGSLPAGGARVFMLPFALVPQLQKLVETVSTEQPALIVTSERGEVWRMDGAHVRKLVWHLSIPPSSTDA